MSVPKVTKQDVLNASSEMLNKDLYVVFTKPENGMKEVMENLEEHLKFQVSLEKNGVMFGAGPFWEDNEIDWNGFWWAPPRVQRQNWMNGPTTAQSPFKECLEVVHRANGPVERAEGQRLRIQSMPQSMPSSTLRLTENDLAKEDASGYFT